MDFIEKLEITLKEKGISQYKLSKETGISESTISSWKKKSKPTIDKVLKILQYLEVTPNDFFEIEENDFKKFYNQLDEYDKIIIDAILEKNKKDNKITSSISKIG